MKIKNEAQRLRTCRKSVELRESADAITDGSADAVRHVAEGLLAQLEEYERIRDGLDVEFEVDGVDALADVLIKARVSRGWTQQRLAKELELAEQQVQKDESGGYETAGLARLADIADVLGYELVGTFRRTTESSGGLADRGHSASTGDNDSASSDPAGARS